MRAIDAFVFAVLSGLAGGAAAADFSPEALTFFEQKIRPVLVQHCYECHGPDGKKLSGGLRLDSRAGLLKGGDSGPAVVVGEPDRSLLITAVRHTDPDLKMPPETKLSATQIGDLVEWVRRGLPDPRVATATKPLGVSLEEGRKFWSLQPVVPPPVPAVKNEAWPRNTVDRFILARLESAGVAPAPPADARTLLRRVTVDLTGLPPTPEEMDAFLADSSPAAFERVVERLLNSPRYGERWGRHWLDVVRYADTCGNASDYPVPQAYRYRDWVIQAFQRNLPYDQFLREQIAGDLLPSTSDAERRERIIATGYLAISRRFGGNRTGEHHLTLEDTIDNVGRALLGMSLSCARCHDHKFDPFTMHDYYGLYGIFHSTRFPFPGAEVGKMQEDFVPLLSPAGIEALLKPHREQVSVAEAALKQLQAAEAEAKKEPESPEKKARVEAATKAVAEANQKLTALRAAAPAIEDAYAVADAKPENVRQHLRGDPKRLGDEIPRHFPAVLGGQMLPPDVTTSGRLQLADWLADPKNPLTARVMVNRLWLYHFGQGLVETPNDFGHQGRRPSHPELLDHLAAQFVASGWSVHAMHKLILFSRTWQMASSATPEQQRLDPNNELFSRARRRRFDAESIRDMLLFVSGQLDESPAGGHPFPPAKSWGWTQHNPFAAVYETRRRSVYLMQQRLRKNPYLALFDGADPSSSTGLRLQSTTPLQALFLMNDPLAHGSATKLAERLLAVSSDEPARIAAGFRLAFNREPTTDELEESRDFLRSYAERLAALNVPPPQRESQAWSALARALLSANEFVFVD